MGALNWKYMVDEILLILLEIKLAIWFYDWNSSRKLNEKRQIAIKIECSDHETYNRHSS